MNWYRVYHRAGVDFAHGQAELGRLLHRKLPRAFHHDVADMHTCDQCGKVGPFLPGWMAYPVWNTIAKFHEPGLQYTKFCSHDCWIEKTGGFDLPQWLDVHREPWEGRPSKAREAWFLAKRKDDDAQRQTKAHRAVPMGKWEGPGWCKWCGGMICHPPGPKAGRQNKARYWHPACVTEWELHSRAERQAAFLRKRDGEGCAWPDCDSTDSLEVDHRVPLWSARDLPDDERRWYYGPGNLWLLCGHHHKKKTKDEAAQRALQRRQEQPQGPRLL